MKKNKNKKVPKKDCSLNSSFEKKLEESFFENLLYIPLDGLGSFDG